MYTVLIERDYTYKMYYVYTIDIEGLCNMYYVYTVHYVEREGLYNMYYVYTV